MVESIGVPIAGQRRGRARTKLVRTLQGKRGNAEPMRKLRLLGEIRRGRLVISRGVAENIGDGLGIRAVVVPQGQDATNNRQSYADSLSLVLSIRNLRQGLLKVEIERAFERRVQGNKNVVRALAAAASCEVSRGAKSRTK